MIGSIKGKMEELTTLVQEASTELYQKAQQSQQAASGGNNEDSAPECTRVGWIILFFRHEYLVLLSRTLLIRRGL